MRINLDFLKKKPKPPEPTGCIKCHQPVPDGKTQHEACLNLKIQCCGSPLSWFGGISKWFCRKCGKEYLHET